MEPIVRWNLLFFANVFAFKDIYFEFKFEIWNVREGKKDIQRIINSHLFKASLQAEAVSMAFISRDLKASFPSIPNIRVSNCSNLRSNKSSSDIFTVFYFLVPNPKPFIKARKNKIVWKRIPRHYRTSLFHVENFHTKLKLKGMISVFPIHPNT